MLAWGTNARGECNVPVPNGNFAAIAAGQNSLGLKADGTLLAWGRNLVGQCNVPDPNEGLRFVAIAAGGSHSLGLLTDGSSWVGGKR